MHVLGTLVMFVVTSLGMNPVELRLDRQLKTWQRRLGLEEWNLAVRLVRKTDLDTDTWGNAEWDPVKRTGIIKVLDPHDYNLKGGELKRDMECTLVHELVHIQVSPLDAKDEEIREEVVNNIMMGLLNRPCPN